MTTYSPLERQAIKQMLRILGGSMNQASTFARRLDQIDGAMRMANWLGAYTKDLEQIFDVCLQLRTEDEMSVFRIRLHGSR